jgi:hypothetical protein
MFLPSSRKLHCLLGAVGIHISTQGRHTCRSQTKVRVAFATSETTASSPTKLGSWTCRSRNSWPATAKLNLTAVSCLTASSSSFYLAVLHHHHLVDSCRQYLCIVSIIWHQLMADYIHRVSVTDLQANPISTNRIDSSNDNYHGLARPRYMLAISRSYNHVIAISKVSSCNNSSCSIPEYHASDHSSDKRRLCLTSPYISCTVLQTSPPSHLQF